MALKLNLVQSYIVEEKKANRTFSNKLKEVCSLIGFEAFVWILGLAYLFLIHSPGETHFTICPLSNLGFEFCPGCGLGNSIS